MINYSPATRLHFEFEVHNYQEGKEVGIELLKNTCFKGKKIRSPLFTCRKMNRQALAVSTNGTASCSLRGGYFRSTRNITASSRLICTKLKAASASTFAAEWVASNSQ